MATFQTTPKGRPGLAPTGLRLLDGPAPPGANSFQPCPPIAFGSDGQLVHCHLWGFQRIAGQAEERPGPHIPGADVHQPSAHFNHSLPRPSNRFAVGIKINGSTMEATSTNGSVMVPGKFKLVTRMAAARGVRLPGAGGRPGQAQGTAPTIMY
jgi:hypothetical protein